MVTAMNSTARGDAGLYASRSCLNILRGLELKWSGVCYVDRRFPNSGDGASQEVEDFVRMPFAYRVRVLV